MFSYTESILIFFGIVYIFKWFVSILLDIHAGLKAYNISSSFQKARLQQGIWVMGACDRMYARNWARIRAGVGN